MRKFSSYGPVNTKLHYHVPRKEVIGTACRQLVGEPPDEGGHYITVWAPRQCGKSWIMNEVCHRLRADGRFRVLKLDMEYLKMQEDAARAIRSVAKEVVRHLDLENVSVGSPDDFHTLFLGKTLGRPLILVIDEFDALTEEAISGLAGIFRYVYNVRKEDPNPSPKKAYLLHGVALIGVRSVLGIENRRGSPFNVQRSLNIANLTGEEVASMFRWHERESNQKVEPAVVDRIIYETRGQPGLVSWFGELLTEGFQEYEPDREGPITMARLDYVHAAATQILPNANILNLISKANQEPHRKFVMELFRTAEKVPFKFDDPSTNFLYMNGVIDREESDGGFFVRFSCPFVQKRLFNHFSYQLFPHLGVIYEPFEEVGHIVTETTLDVEALMRRYERHLQKNRDWMLKDAPRRSDLRIYEAVFHFNLYEYLVRFFGSYKTEVWPEFPTGNGKVDILIRHGGTLHALELKSYRDNPAYHRALAQAAEYGRELGLDVIHLIVFVEYIGDDLRKKYEGDHRDGTTGVTVTPLLIATGN